MTLDVQHEAQKRIESYLGRSRARLRGMDREDIREIVEELRGHIQEKTEAAGEIKMATVDAVLAALGSPEELASQYVTDDLLARAEVSRSPWRTLEGLFHWASLSVVANHASISFLIDVPRSELRFEPCGLNRFRPNLSFCGRR